MKSKRQLKIQKREDRNLYEARFTHLGKRYSIYDKTIGGLREKYTEKLKSLVSVKHIKSMLFNTWYDKYINIYKKSELKENTLKNMNGNFHKHILPYIGKMPLKKITSENIQVIVNNMNNIPRQKTIVFTQLNACFEQALKCNHISHNPCYAVEIKKNKGGKGKGLTKEQEKTLLEYLKIHQPPITTLIYLYLTTGMRRTELLRIKQSDIDYKRNEIHVRGTKTDNADRVIQVSKKVIDLFPKRGVPFEDWSPDKVNREFKKIVDVLGFKKVAIHTLRHTFISNCVESGVPLAVVQQWAGHGNISTTNRYIHITEDYKQQFVKNLEYDFVPQNVP